MGCCYQKSQSGLFLSGPVWSGQVSSGLVQFGPVWSGMVWSSLVWYVWSGPVRYGLVCFSLLRSDPVYSSLFRIGPFLSVWSVLIEKQLNWLEVNLQEFKVSWTTVKKRINDVFNKNFIKNWMFPLLNVSHFWIFY